MASSGAWVRIRSSHDCFVSSIAAQSSPRGVTAASRHTSSVMRTSSFPIPFNPNASARRRAGSTVSTSTRPPCSTTAMAASAAAVVVLPTPPGPQAITMSLAASSCATVLAGGRPARSLPVRSPPGRAVAFRHSPNSSPREWATCRVVRTPKLRANR